MENEFPQARRSCVVRRHEAHWVLACIARNQELDPEPIAFTGSRRISQDSLRTVEASISHAVSHPEEDDILPEGCALGYPVGTVVVCSMQPTDVNKGSAHKLLLQGVQAGGQLLS